MLGRHQRRHHARPAGWLKARTQPNRKATMKKGQAADGRAR